jgi:hypothetical protein
MMDEPRFAQPIPNVTVAVGRDANLPCVVEHLGTYKVMHYRLFDWLKFLLPSMLLINWLSLFKDFNGFLMSCLAWIGRNSVRKDEPFKEQNQLSKSIKI